MGLCRGGSCWGMAYRSTPQRTRARAGQPLEPRDAAPRLRAAPDPGAARRRAHACARSPSSPIPRIRPTSRELDLHGRARLVAQGIGARGPCVDYIRKTLEHMHEVGVRDPHLERILHAALALRENGSDDPDLWPARLHHLRRDSPQPERARAVLRRAARRPRRSRWPTVAGWSPGAAGAWSSARATQRAVPYFALAMQDAAHLQRATASAAGKAEAFASPLFAEGAFTRNGSRRPPRRLRPPEDREAPDGLPGRLQHFVCATTRLPEMLDFYRGLGMVESDRVLEGEELAAVFLRSDPEHHSFAAFRAPRVARRPPLLRDQRLARHPRLGRPHGRACASRCGGDRAATGRATTCSS